MALVICFAGISQSASDLQLQNLYSDAKAAEARGDLAGAAASYQAALKIAPRLGPAYNNLGAIYFKQGEYAKAASTLEQGLKINSNMTSASALLGMSLFQMGKYAEARSPLEAALSANPNDGNIELFLVNTLTRLGEFETAAQHLRHLANREPNDQHIWYLLGKVYTQLAQQALAKMNSIDPNSVWAHEISGEIMESMKNYDGAIVEYKKAVEVAPRQPGIHYKLGDLYWSLSQWDNATVEFQAELANDPANCMAQWKIGDTLVQQSIRPEEALSDIDKALTMCPNLTGARLDRGRLLLKLHRAEEAIPDLKTAASADPKEPTVHYSLAQAYRALGRAQNAQSEMEIFSKLDANARAATAQQAQEVINNKASPH
ncbi:MAG: tetratricopeptide repeat protein [Acidobacteriaceae bacterium]|nr:tetratricopeptide repeat protein [Acidobacteriaceae bacterium]MBV9782099.1 tetratricopeptide repeat protein [Acidobacteriaceae bacterium]